MAEVKIEYFAIMHIGDKPDNPSQIVRKTYCDDPPAYKIEGCNRNTPWKESNHYIKYIMGMADEAYSMTGMEANKVLVKWKKRWEKPRFDEKML